MGIKKLVKTPQHKKRILFVEDDKSIREVTTLFLEAEGFLVDCASNGQEALDYLETHDLPALILLNLKMPVMDGFQFSEKMQQNPKIANIPVVITSGADSYFAPTYLARTHARAYLQRPPSLEALLATVRRYCS